MTSLFTPDETGDHWIIPNLINLLARQDPEQAEQLRADLERRTT